MTRNLAIANGSRISKCSRFWRQVKVLVNKVI